MKKISVFMLIIIIVSLATSSIVKASSVSDLTKIEKKGFVTTNGLNVRTLGSTKGKIIAVINKGVKVHVFGEKNRWYYVEYASNKKGWVHSNYIELEKTLPQPDNSTPDLNKIEKKGYVTTNGLNVRTLGSTKGKIIAVINKGVKVHVFGEKNKWYYVEYASNKKGWVHSNYIQLEKIPSQPDTSTPDLNKIEKKGYVTTNGLNVRTLGSTNGSIVAVINKGVKVHVFGEKNKWYYVEYASNKKGWVHSNYIKFSATETPPINTDSLSNKSYGWYFMRKTNHQQPGFDTSYKALLDKYNGITIGDKNKKDIFLTFDNGYENGYTVKILDALKRQNVKASFFVQGSYIDNNPEIVKRMVREGHLVLNHTNDHPELPSVSKERLKYEINIVADKYKKLTGKEMAKFMRPPSGVFSERTLAETKNLGYRTVFWSLAYKDWDVKNQPGKAASYKHVTDNVHNGAVMLLHSVSKSNTEAMDDILKELKKQGYTFKLLTQYP